MAKKHRFKVGDYARLYDDYDKYAIGVVIKLLPRRRIRVAYPHFGQQIDAHEREFVKSRSGKRFKVDREVRTLKKRVTR